MRSRGLLSIQYYFLLSCLLLGALCLLVLLMSNPGAGSKFWIQYDYLCIAVCSVLHCVNLCGVKCRCLQHLVSLLQHTCADVFHIIISVFNLLWFYSFMPLCAWCQTVSHHVLHVRIFTLHYTVILSLYLHTVMIAVSCFISFFFFF